MKKKLLMAVSLWFMLGVSVHAGKRIVVDLSAQTATAYENGAAVFSGNISTGTAKRPTPTGSFRVLEKDIDHISTSWPKPNGGAKMHYMLRLTNYGIAMHLGYVPSYPASHGCIRLQNGFAQRMYRWAHVGVPVRVVGHAPARVYRSKVKANTLVRSKRKKGAAIFGTFGSFVEEKKPYSQRSTALTESKQLKSKKKSSRLASTQAFRPLDILSTSPKSIKRTAASQGKKGRIRGKMMVGNAASSSAVSALDILNASPKVVKKMTTLQKKKKRIRKKKMVTKTTSYTTSSTLDVLSTSPKAIERVESVQKKRWKNRPKRKSPRVDPLKAMRS